MARQQGRVCRDLSIYDRREASALEDKQERISHLTGGLSINWQLGRKSYKSLKGYDELWRSPGWPIFCPQIEAIQSGGVLNSPMNLFLSFALLRTLLGLRAVKVKGQPQFNL